MDFWNALVRDGTITDGILLDSISCAVCESAKMAKSKVSKVREKVYPSRPFHIVQGDIYDAEDVDSRNGFRCILVFIDVCTGTVFQYFMICNHFVLIWNRSLTNH